MIGQLWGKVITIEGQTLILRSGDIGYSITCTTPTLQALRNATDDVHLWIETIFKAESLQLYGFLSFLEQRWFRLLITVQGVGARMALNILSALTIQDLVETFQNQDSARLSVAEGVGPKLATRLITELKGKLFPGLTTTNQAFTSSLLEDATSALSHLGFSRTHIQEALQKAAPHPHMQVEDLIRQSLHYLSKTKP